MSWRAWVLIAFSFSPFLPMMIDKLYRPEVLHASDARFDDMVRYMDWASEGFDHTFTQRP